jgi:DNA-binding transcriptional LysR family regulator
MGLIRVFSYQVRPAVRAGMLREVLPHFVPSSVPVHLLHGTEDMVPLKVRAFVDFCVPRLQARLAV